MKGEEAEVLDRMIVLVVFFSFFLPAEHCLK